MLIYSLRIVKWVRILKRITLIHNICNVSFILEEEFRRISTLHLEPTFMKMLDYYTPKHLTIFSCKGTKIQILKKRMDAKQKVLNKIISVFLIIIG